MHSEIINHKRKNLPQLMIPNPQFQFLTEINSGRAKVIRFAPLNVPEQPVSTGLSGW